MGIALYSFKNIPSESTYNVVFMAKDIPPFFGRLEDMDINTIWKCEFLEQVPLIIVFRALETCILSTIRSIIEYNVLVECCKNNNYIGCGKLNYIHEGFEYRQNGGHSNGRHKV